MAFLFTRNAKVYVEYENPNDGGSAGSNTVWQIPVLDGFSFSQSVESAEITASEAGSAPARGRLLFNTAVAPVEWSFSTYVRPFATGGSGTAGNWGGTANFVHAVEEVLWAMMFGATGYTVGTGTFTGGASFHTPALTATGSKYTLAASNVANFASNWSIYFSFEDGATTQQVYKVTDAVVNSATIDFDIEGIATIQWSGFGKGIVDAGTTKPTRDIYEKITDTSTFIRNKLSVLDLDGETPALSASTIALTGGSITIENNISYLTPEELGVVNQPFANVAGTRSITGNITCYLDTKTNGSAALWNSLLGATTTIRNNFNMAIKIGGSTGNRLVLDIPTAHLEIPTLGVEDLLTLDIAFHAQPSTGSFDSTDEFFIEYRT